MVKSASVKNSAVGKGGQGRYIGKAESNGKNGKKK